MLKDNWLNTVSSATYKFTFYITDSDVWNNPFAYLSPTDEPALNAGKAIIIAEDGVEGAFNIQNVNISAAAASVNNGHATANEIQFDLNENLGFSFMDRILAAGRMMKKENVTGTNFAAQLYVLKLDFIGRDPVTGATVKYPDPFLYSMKISEINGSLGPAGASYFIIGAPLEKLAQEDSAVRESITVENITTAKTFADQLKIALNKSAQNMVENLGHPATGGVKPLIEWDVDFDPSATIQAIDTMAVPGFDLRSAEWAGTADAVNQGGLAESVETLGTRQTTLNRETQLTSWIATQLNKNLPTFADYLVAQAEKGITYAVEVEQITTLSGEIHGHFNQEIRKIKVVIKIRRTDDITPPDEASILALRNVKSVQEERFRSQILPSLVKKYSYQYTGENTEVEAVDIKIQNGFFNAMSPGVGVYYADEKFQFESNIRTNKPVEEWVANPHLDSQVVISSPVRYLSDLQLDKFNVNQNSVFDIKMVSAEGQMVNEISTGSKIAAGALQSQAGRLLDNQNMTIETKGDPIFMGTNNKNFFNTQTGSVYLAFVSFTPEPVDLLERQRRGPIDLVTTGIYKITYIHSKFSQGKFTQSVSCYRDPNSNPILLAETLINLEVGE